MGNQQPPFFAIIDSSLLHEESNHDKQYHYLT